MTMIYVMMTGEMTGQQLALVRLGISTGDKSSILAHKKEPGKGVGEGKIHPIYHVPIRKSPLSTK